MLKKEKGRFNHVNLSSRIIPLRKIELQSNISCET